MAFELSRPVRFAACDPADIAYYPALFEICDGVIEDWTDDALGISRRELHLDRKLALPTVDMHASFRKSVRLGDLLDIALHIRRVGTSSVDLALTAAVDGDECFSEEYRQVLMDMTRFASWPWLDDWRQRLEATVEGEER